jgi:micrococcal nuclease
VGSGGLRRLGAAIGLALLAGCAGAPAPPERSEEVARVDSVRDGDTILLATGARVRLVQVDAPELMNECYGTEATEALHRLVPPGALVRLERDPNLDGSDRHGRLLRYAYVGSRNVALELVRVGAAAPYFYRGERGRHARTLEEAARNARARRLGLWGGCPSARLAPDRAIATGPARAAR